jgi:hypothetical protein
MQGEDLVQRNNNCYSDNPMFNVCDDAWGHEIRVVLAERPNNGRLQLEAFNVEVAGPYFSFPAIDYFGIQTNSCG